MNARLVASLVLEYKNHQQQLYSSVNEPSSDLMKSTYLLTDRKDYFCVLSSSYCFFSNRIVFTNPISTNNHAG